MGSILVMQLYKTFIFMYLQYAIRTYCTKSLYAQACMESHVTIEGFEVLRDPCWENNNFCMTTIIIKHLCQQLCIAMKYGITVFLFQCYISHTLPFSFQFQETSRQASFSGGKPPFPITTRCISIYFHSMWMAHIHIHTHTHSHTLPAYMIYVVSSVRSCISLLAWLQPQCLYYALCFCHWDGGGDSLTSNAATSAAALVTHTHAQPHTLTCTHTGTRADWLVEDQVN